MGNTVKSISVIDSINGNVDFAEAEKLINFSNVSTVIIHIHNTPEKIEEQAYAASEKSEKIRVLSRMILSLHILRWPPIRCSML